MNAKLREDFYLGRATELAPLLLGKIICVKHGEEITRARITETECYFGEADTACHANRGRTPRTSTLYERGGIAYVYLCYGIHSLLNVVTGEKDFPEAVLIRGVAGAGGPGLVTRLLDIDRSFNGESFVNSSRLWLEDDGAKPSYSASPRVGIGYAEEADRLRPWRYTVLSD